ncbi:hypothetical protein HZH68_012419 [Vespula germanica]|uniref:Uncharacterized protein n=2 Tax=Vespula TaxID=7451 RepID=A0A834JIF9_VESGE|nr:uncharacterized protein LOC122633692 [Vespula pensylvanica]KAF7388477.1 hypothetical protein HZH68_012419 [Vespula germanica]KAF7410822.1 hypothetical protein H0235_013429 [Vespula pensylvanica]
MSSGRQQEDSEEKDQRSKNPMIRHEKYKTGIINDEKTFAGSLSQESADKCVKIDSTTSSKDDFKKSFKIDIPKNNNPSDNPRYSSEKPIVLNKLPIFDEESRLS